MSFSQSPSRGQPAVVTRPVARPRDASQYLILSADGAPLWTEDPATATAFASMHEAMRASARLPASIRAYGLPLLSELSADRTVH